MVHWHGRTCSGVPDFKFITMSTLSHKILQLMAYESQLKALKTEIATHRVALVDTPEIYIHNAVFEEQLKKYELISLQYNELFEGILPDLNKMSEEYQELSNRRELHPFFFR
jgi:hypothetical protein